ncbi:MAG TPA: hydrogenase nickel incorporation protein HypB [Spirochaetia bacterium]|nr:hydrogenase nickel incorporation protein HypB [Spirochaetia bacterium]
MKETRVIRIRESILAENAAKAEDLRERLSAHGVTLLNLMSSPGSRKMSFILRTIEALRDRYSIAVVEADIDSTVDADRIAAAGIPAVQIETGGFCHIEAAMMEAAVSGMDLDAIDLLVLENVGNLICTAQHDTGAHLSVAILSFPEGDDKPLKYPIMFRAADAVIVNKTDYGDLADFNLEAARRRVEVLNPGVPLIPLSCRTGAGVDAWIAWLEPRIRSSFPGASERRY